jgi:hypothetical protein
MGRRYAHDEGKEMKILDNRLLLNGLLLFAFYWLVAPLVPKPYVSSAMSLLSLSAGTLMFSRYAEQTWQILWHRERSEAGSHYAILGASLVSLGVVYSGIYSLLWIYFGQPDDWTASATSSFGRGLVAVGFFLMAISPDTDNVGAGYPIGFWRSLGVLLAIILAFIAGTHFAQMG